jgi:3-oxoacyl-[acyl-carrier protein] reductase
VSDEAAPTPTSSPAPRLAGRVAVVTGASRGLGRAVALRLAAEGACVVVNYRERRDAADEVVEAITAAGGRARAVAADVTVPDAAQALVAGAVADFGRLDILVNNAGITRDGLLMKMSEADWDKVLTTNLGSVFLVSRAAVRPMMRQRGGRIINMTSIAGLGGNAGQTNYSAAKAGIVGFTKSLAKEVGSRGVTVNAVAPGYITTDLTADLPAELIETARQLTPLGRLGTPEDVAAAVAFLASDDAAFITAQVLRVDGGMAF